MVEICNYCGKIFKKFVIKEIVVPITINKLEVKVPVIAHICPHCKAHCYELLNE